MYDSLIEHEAFKHDKKLLNLSSQGFDAEKIVKDMAALKKLTTQQEERIKELEKQVEDLQAASNDKPEEMAEDVAPEPTQNEEKEQMDANN